jgi:hypothetical protein
LQAKAIGLQAKAIGSQAKAKTYLDFIFSGKASFNHTALQANDGIKVGSHLLDVVTSDQSRRVRNRL